VASEKGAFDALTVLLNNKATINVKTNGGRTALELALLFTRNPTIISLLIAFGADVNVQDDKELTPLSYAIMMENFGLTKLLLEKGASTEPYTTYMEADVYSYRHNNNNIFKEILDIYGKKSKIRNEFKTSSSDLLEASVKQFWSYKAASWWWESDPRRKEATCDYCNVTIKKTVDGYLIHAKLACTDCADRLSKNMWENLASNPSYYGEGLLNKVSNYFLHN